MLCVCSNILCSNVQSLKQIEGSWQSDADNEGGSNVTAKEIIAVKDTVETQDSNTVGYSSTNSHTENLQYLRDTLKRLLGKGDVLSSHLSLIYGIQITLIANGRRRKISFHGVDCPKFSLIQESYSRIIPTLCNCLVLRRQNRIQRE
jgi:hypothetical protein